MTKTDCRVCGAQANAFICRPCTAEVEEALASLPGLVSDVVTRQLREAKTYRAARGRQQVDEELAGLEEEYGWRTARIPAHLRSSSGRVTLPSTASVGDESANGLLAAARNTLVTWARHLAESRGTEVVLNVGAELQGPLCGQTHVHQLPMVGCQDGPSGCRSYHPGHVHYPSRPGCPDDCAELHCEHDTCARIRRGELTGAAAALVRWFLLHIDSVRYDEAGAEMHRELTQLQSTLQRAVDRSPSSTWAGPCGECGAQLYVHHVHNGATEIKCDGTDRRSAGCGKTYTLGERQQWLADSVSENLVTIAELLESLPHLFPSYPRPPRSVALAWVRQGRIVAHGLRASGEPTFVGGELLDLVEKYRPKAFAPRPSRKSA